MKKESKKLKNILSVAKILHPFVPKNLPKRPIIRKLTNGKYKINKYIFNLL